MSPNETPISPAWPSSKKESSIASLEKILVLVLAVIAIFLAGRYAWHTANLLSYPYDWDEDEGYHIAFAQNLLAGRPIYTDLSHLQLFIQTYPPLHGLILSLFVKCIGAKMIAGRLLALFSAAGLFALIAWVVRRETGRWSYGLLAAAFVAGSPYMIIWGPLCRVDVLMLFFLFGGLALMRPSPASPVRLIASLICFLAAGFTKQQAALLIPAAFIFLWQQNRRVTVASMAGFALATGIILLLIQNWSGGNFWRCVVSFQKTDYRLEWAITRTINFLKAHAALTAGMVLWLGMQMKSRRWGLWSSVAVLAVGSGLLAGKAGASINYFLGAVVAGVICSVLCLARWTEDNSTANQPWARMLAMFFLAGQGIFFLLTPINEPTAADRQAGDKILELARSVPGDIMVERRAIFSVLTGRRPVADFCTLSYLYYADVLNARKAQSPGSYRPVWDLRELEEAIARKNYSFIMVEPVFIPPPLMSAITESYTRIDGEPIRMNTCMGQNFYQIGLPKK